MKILIIQLARLGDIYQTWPSVRALRRKWPNAEIHFLARSKFAPALSGLEGLSRVHLLDTKEILGPLIALRPNLEEAESKLVEVVQSLKTEGFDLIINLSFSPFSSRLVPLIAKPTCDVRGYTRHSDGYLAIPDDTSAYFYGQVGHNRANRLHVTDLFASVSGVDLEAQDWREPQAAVETAGGEKAQRSGIVVHVGASQFGKSYSAHQWQQVIRGLLYKQSEDVYLIGAKEEKEIALTVAQVSSGRAPIDLVGQTTLEETFRVIAGAQLLVGADSAPVHMAALVGTPVLNLSFAAVNFWETGPKSSGSRILFAQEAAAMPSDRVVAEALQMLQVSRDADTASRIDSAKAQRSEAAVFIDGPLAPPRINNFVEGDQGWRFLSALYMGGELPKDIDANSWLGLERLAECNDLALEQIRLISKAKDPARQKAAVAILDRCDEILKAIEQFSPFAGIAVRWLQTEKVRLGPVSIEELFKRSHEVHNDLAQMLKVYLGPNQRREDAGKKKEVSR